jgi:hypothetical protein
MTLPYSNPTTSKEAAENASMPKVRADRIAIALYIANRGVDGATDDEIMRALPQVHQNAVRARRGEIWGHGVITDVLNQTRATATGARAKVWHITAKGLRGLRREGYEIEGGWSAPEWTNPE